MMVASMITMANLYLFPLLEISTLHYKPQAENCNGLCAVEEPCIINGTLLGERFGNVLDSLTLPFGAIASSLQFIMLMRIFGAKFPTSTLTFFCLAVLPTRFIFMMMQTYEFKSIGGDLYVELISNPHNFQCNLFSGFLDAVFLLHVRFFFLVTDFVTFHTMLVVVPLYFGQEDFRSNYKNTDLTDTLIKH
ncbi:unnamed protein product [Caenorhabditis sp. 36 PRJEB53466]|nr:unnamed protein product [Caenorhabditis sp. 36 PRJEB53466]